MVTIRKRVYFKCPKCGHATRYALQISGEKNSYVCERCSSISTPKNYLLGSFVYGAVLGGLMGVIAYWIFTRYLFTASPAFAILAAVPIGLILAWLVAPILSRVFYRWTLIKPGS
jgi:hypothetical protein